MASGGRDPTGHLVPAFRRRVGRGIAPEGLTDAGFYLAFACLWFWSATRASGWSWRAALGFKALEQLDWFVFRLLRAFRDFRQAPRVSSMHFFGLMGTFHICQIVAVIVAATLDRRAGIRRDWLHHLGAAAIVAESLQFLFSGFGAYFLRWWSEVWLHLVT